MDTSPPSTDPTTCPCGQTMNTNLEFLREGPLQKGDICIAKVSIYAPFRELVGTPPAEVNPFQSFKSTLATVDGVMGKLRPCVHMRRSGDHAQVYLMATFEGRETVPDVFNPFMVQVSTPSNGHLVESHLHTTPEWPYDSLQWVVSLPIWVPVNRALDRRWRCNNRQGYHFSTLALDQLQEIGIAQERDWNDKLQTNPEYIDEYRAQLHNEYVTHRYDRQYQQSITSVKPKSWLTRAFKLRPRWWTSSPPTRKSRLTSQAQLPTITEPHT